MTASVYRATDALYLITLKHNQAERLFRDWARDNRVEHSVVSGNRLSLYSAYAFDKFMLTWTHGFDRLVIWDTWSRRHIYLD
jgi:hypothetical protein